MRKKKAFQELSRLKKKKKRKKKLTVFFFFSFYRCCQNEPAAQMRREGHEDPFASPSCSSTLFTVGERNQPRWLKAALLSRLQRDLQSPDRLFGQSQSRRKSSEEKAGKKGKDSGVGQESLKVQTINHNNVRGKHARLRQGQTRTP